MEKARFDAVAQQLATGSDRRRVLKGIGGLAAGALAAVLPLTASGDHRRRCIERCVKHKSGPNRKARKVRKRCRRTCENR